VFIVSIETYTATLTSYFIKKYYGMNCRCNEKQPRRGKNLPMGGLDSRAKKLSPQDADDYEFTLKWIEEFAHSIYRDRSNKNRVVGLLDLAEVSLCKAHSSTLYRAKKKHLRMNAPPSPSSSLAERSSEEMHPYGIIQGGGLAAKVREIAAATPYHPHQEEDFDLKPSTSYKRTRLSRPPISSASTPLLTAQHPPHPMARQPIESSFSSRLPPLHLRNPLPLHNVLETVSLKNFEHLYYIRNLAITDHYTFSDLLSEIDFKGTIPNGKRLVISDERCEKFFPLNQPIRSVIRYPTETHMELCLSLTDKASIDWNQFK
jgi:hypothetical protein